ALGSLEWPYPPSSEIPDEAEAIVVLSGYVRPPDATRTRAELGADTLYRCLHAVTLHHKRRDCPIVVCGGNPDGTSPGPPYAHAMRDFLRDQGVAELQILVEDHSRTTYENAVKAAELLRERGLRHIVLVTDAEHMFRSAGCFRKQGLEVTPAPC